METDIKRIPLKLLIEKGDEMQVYVKNLSDINMMREKNGLKPLYACSKETRTDMVTGLKYSLLVVHKAGLEKTNPNKFIPFQDVIPVNANGEIIQEASQKVKQASIVFNSLQIENWQAKRGLKLQAQTMNSHAGEFDFSLEE